MNQASPDDLRTYLAHHPLAVISTVDEAGNPHGAVVYVGVGLREHTLFFLTKTGTQKYQNLIMHPSLAVTIYDETLLSTLQAQGHAQPIRDNALIEEALTRITRAQSGLHDWLPPIAKLRAGAYEIFEVTLTDIRLAEFRGQPIGGEQIMKKL